MRNRWFYYVIPLVAVALVGAWAMLRHLAQPTIEPPYSQEELAQVIAQSVGNGDAARFTGALFDLADLNEYVAAARETADSSEVESLDSFAQAQRNDWPLYQQQMMDEFEQITQQMRALGLHKPVYDGFAVDLRRLDPATGRIIFEQFDIYLLDGEDRYTLEADMLRQTADGWKFSGQMLSLYPTP